MNKFVILALFACVASAFAGPVNNTIEDLPSEFAVFEDNDTEIAGLPENKRQLFQDFCFATRDQVKSQLQGKVNEHASKGFQLLMKAVEDIGSSITDAESQKIQDNIELINADAKNFWTALTNVVSNIRDEAKLKVVEIMAQMKSQMNVEMLQEIAENSCRYITKTLKVNISDKFKAEKTELIRSTENEQTKALIYDTKLEDLGCATISRVNKLVFGCKLVNTLVALVNSSL